MQLLGHCLAPLTPSPRLALLSCSRLLQSDLLCACALIHSLPYSRTKKIAVQFSRCFESLCNKALKRLRKDGKIIDGEKGAGVKAEKGGDKEGERLEPKAAKNKGSKGAKGVDDKVAAEARIQFELQQMQEEVTKYPAVPRALRSPVFRQPFAIVIVLHLASQFSGFGGTFYYPAAAMRTTGLSASQAVDASLVLTTFVIIMVALNSVALMEIVGRRLLTLIGLGLMIVFGIALIISTCVGERYAGGFTYATQSFGSICLVVAVAALAVGPGSVPWFLPAEMFPMVFVIEM